MKYIANFTDVTMDELREAIEFEHRSVRVYGKVHPQPRLTAWYAPVEYTYSGLTWPARELPPLLERLRREVEEYAEVELPTVLANLYRNGTDKVGWHSDDEPLFGADPVIASLSFGATRTFQMRRKADRTNKMSFELENGSLLIMPRGTQPHWEHALPVRKRVSKPRINLTFRSLS